MGRPRKPTSMLADRGGTKYQRKPEPDAATGDPTCPEWMPDTGRAEWDRVVEDMRERNFLSSSYQTAMELYCMAYSDWLSSLETLEKEGTVVEKVTQSGSSLVEHPAVKQRDVAYKKMFDVMREFGMTPASKSRIEGIKPIDAPKSVQSRPQSLGVVG